MAGEGCHIAKDIYSKHLHITPLVHLTTHMGPPQDNIVHNNRIRID